jgi:hypothetical protein
VFEAPAALAGLCDWLAAVDYAPVKRPTSTIRAGGTVGSGATSQLVFASTKSGSGATQPLVSRLAKVCYLGKSGLVVVSALLACRPAGKSA